MQRLLSENPPTKQEMCTFDEEGVEETPDERGDPEAQLLRMEEESLSETCSSETQNEKSTELRYFDKNQDATGYRPRKLLRNTGSQRTM